MKLGRRTVRRGAIDKIVRFAEARAARLAAGPPVRGRARSAPAEVALRGLAAVARSWPFEVEASPWSARAWPVDGDAERGPSLVLALTEGAFFGGSFAWLASIVGAERRPVVACDAFLHPAQVEAAARAGAVGIAPMMSAADRAGVDLAELASWSARRALFVLPLMGEGHEQPIVRVATQRPEVFLFDGTRPVALASGRDPESFRPLEATGRAAVTGTPLVVALDAFGVGATCHVDPAGVGDAGSAGRNT